jgi:hypothetical protein
VGVEALQGIAQAALQDHLAVVDALSRRLARRDVEAVQDGVALRFEPGQRGVFDDGFGVKRCVIGRVSCLDGPGRGVR